ncbi:hypothetical protein [Planomonospora algeriensis]
MFEVHGYVNGGVAYAVTVGQARPEAAAVAGIVSGTRSAVELLAGRAGRQITRPHGAPVVLDLDDPASVRAALHAWTQVVREAGEVPEMT